MFAVTLEFRTKSDICLTFIQLRNYRKCRPRVKRCWEKRRDKRKRNEMKQSSTFVSRATRCMERVNRVFLFFVFFFFYFFLSHSSKGRPVSLSVMADNELSIRFAWNSCCHLESNLHAIIYTIIWVLGVENFCEFTICVIRLSEISIVL